MSHIDSYLKRIGYSGPTTPTPDLLRNLHRAHLLAVPFENLDIALGRRIVCEEESFLRKIIDRRRGGFCYELNGAFAALLRALGFQVTLLSALVPRQDGSHTPEFDHLTLRLDLEESWLADVGFGDCFLEPLRLEIGLEQIQGGLKYRIVEDNNSLHVDRTESGDVWERQYSFTLTPRRLDEFAAMCHYHQTSPESPFTRKKLCSLATVDGRITLSEWKLITTRHGGREERMLESEQEWRKALKSLFGITLEA
ncbi:MAG: acetyltransferase [Acidobacteria bacterium]|nr:MAG: acetyltransferase [Acidobacteriota bacterium]